MHRSRFFGQAFATLCFILTSAVPAAAQNSEQQRREGEEQWGTRQPTFTELDTNRDGYLSREEAAQWNTLIEKFAAIDKSSDNQIDRAEFRDFEAEQIEEILLEFKGSSD